ncbi:hypothetical protein D3C86_1130050 [compost metagenome]
MRRPSISMAVRCSEASGSGSGRMPAVSSFAKSVSIQRVWTLKASSDTKSGCAITARWNGSTVARPSMRNSLSARRARAMAWARVAPVTMSLAISESKVPGTCEPASTPVSTRTPGPEGASNTWTGPGVGRKPRPTSSALMRNSKEWPRGAGVSLTDSGRPSAMRSCSMTRSMPVVSSVTGCSTCRRVLTSRKEIAPLALSMNSTVPAPV